MGPGEGSLSHPLIALASDKDVRQAAAFRAKAGDLNGERLRGRLRGSSATRRALHDAGKRYLAERSGKPATERRRNKDEEHVGAALVRYALARGDGLPLPDEGLRLIPLEYQVRLKAGPADAPETKGIGRLDLLGVTSDDALAVIKLRCSGRTRRAAVSETRRCGLPQALAMCAVATRTWKP